VQLVGVQKNSTNALMCGGTLNNKGIHAMTEFTLPLDKGLARCRDLVMRNVSTRINVADW